MSRQHLQTFLRQSGLTPIAFHRLDWFQGVYHSSWSPIVPGQKNHLQGAANLSRNRTRSDLSTMTEPTREKLARLLDNRSEAERRAHSLSLSLRNMDIAIENVAEFYNEQLVNSMAIGHLYGPASTSLDNTLYAHVHSFFMHLGAARDYLGSLIALRIGKDPNKIDSMVKLIKVLRTGDLSSDAVLAQLAVKGYVQYNPASIDKVETAGWLKDVTGLRNEFMHHRPYGSKFVECRGFTQAIDEGSGLYRYVRPILNSDGTENDALDLMVHHYITSSTFFLGCAKQAGYDTAMLTLSDKDIISVGRHGN